MRSQPSKISRKWRKLRRDPAAFWRDSWLSGAEKVPAKPALPDVIALPAPKAAGPKFFIDIPAHGRVTTSAIKINERNATLLLYPQGQRDAYADIIERMKAMRDFKIFNEGILLKGVYEDLGDASALSIVNRITREQKEQLAEVRFVVAFDAPPALLQALRSCGTQLRTVLVLTGDETPTIDPMHTDCVVALAHHVLPEGLRRCIRVADATGLCLAVRRFVQENSRKDPDILLPLLNADTYDPTLLDFDPTRYQGIIRLKSDATAHALAAPADHMDALVARLSAGVESMLVLESVYMRYRDLCEAVEGGASPARLIALSLYDGFLYDVR